MRLLPLQGMSVGEGDVYSGLGASCVNAVIGVLSNPDHELYDLVSDPEYTLQFLNQLKTNYSVEFDAYYDPLSVKGGANAEKWDILVGEYSDMLLEIQMLGMEISGDEEFCGPAAVTLLNSHQGSAGS